VHGLGQVAHFDMAKEWDTFALMGALNFHLKPNPIAIVACVPTDDDFHARHSAKERNYLFRVLARRPPITHLRGFVWQVNFPLDIDAMRAGCEHLIGHHDFTTFRSTMCQADSPMRTLDEIRIEEHVLPYGSEFHFHVRARSFLHNQVRSLVGSIERVGSGRWAPERLGDALAACDRTACGPVAPPDGLYFDHVSYLPDPFVVSDD
jgi:tRNA pseudouridine38-40 synthase